MFSVFLSLICDIALRFLILKRYISKRTSRSVLVFFRIPRIDQDWMYSTYLAFYTFLPRSKKLKWVENAQNFQTKSFFHHHYRMHTAVVYVNGIHAKSHGIFHQLVRHAKHFWTFFAGVLMKNWRKVFKKPSVPSFTHFVYVCCPFRLATYWGTRPIFCKYTWARLLLTTHKSFD